MIAKWMVACIGVLMFAMAGGTCAPVDSGGDGGTVPETRTPKLEVNLRNIGPVGGHVTAVAFHPTQQDEVWASGGATSGLYRSKNGGAAWDLLEGTPPNHSTCCLRFSPSDSDHVYAPDRNGRGMLRTTNGGATWEVSWQGLPKVSGDSTVYDMSVHPLRPGRLYLATGAGLFTSADNGTSFTRVDSLVFWGEYDFRSVSFHADGRLFAGGGNGGVFACAEDGEDWQVIIPSGGVVAVSQLIAAEKGLYIAYATGEIYLNRLYAAGRNMRLDPGAFVSGTSTCMAVVPGGATQFDRIFAGTTIREGADNWGLYRSDDGGGTFVRSDSGLEGECICAIAVDPFDAQHMLVGTTGGVRESNDGGQSWSPSDDGLHGARSSGFAEDALDADHLLMALAPDANGLPDLLETFDGGRNWATISSLQAGATCVNLDPRNPDIVLVGTTGGDPSARAGIYRSIDGAAGPWQSVLAASVHVAEIRRHALKPDVLYAHAVDYRLPATEADVGLYASSDNGASWRSLGRQAAAFAVHPARVDECVAVGDDAYATSDAFETDPVSLGLAAFAGEDAFTAVAFDPEHTQRLLVAGRSGDLFVTENYAASAGSITWKRMATPVAGMLQIARIAIVPQTQGAAHLYFAAYPAGSVRSDGTGVYFSTDDGVTWQNIIADARPCTLATDIVPSASAEGRIYLPLWSGGVYELTLTETTDP